MKTIACDYIHVVRQMTWGQRLHLLFVAAVTIIANWKGRFPESSQDMALGMFAAGLIFVGFMPFVTAVKRRIGMVLFVLLCWALSGYLLIYPPSGF